MRTTNRKQGSTNIKGFTLVELVIVIAVIAILAGVLIPTFSNVVENAKNAAFKSDATNLYKQYVTEVAHTGKVEKNLIIYGGDNKYIVYKDGKQLDDVYDIKTAKQELGIPQTKALDVIDGFEDILVDTDKTLVRVKSDGQLFDGAKIVIAAKRDGTWFVGSQKTETGDFVSAIVAGTGDIPQIVSNTFVYELIQNNDSWAMSYKDGNSIEYLRAYSNQLTGFRLSNNSVFANGNFNQGYIWYINVDATGEIRIENDYYYSDYNKRRIKLQQNGTTYKFGNYSKESIEYTLPYLYLINE